MLDKHNDKKLYLIIKYSGGVDMGMMKAFLMDVMEDMGEDEITQAVLDRANDIVAHRMDSFDDFDTGYQADENMTVSIFKDKKELIEF
jgi:hypothetical protein